jgi:hypothetical protein
MTEASLDADPLAMVYYVRRKFQNVANPLSTPVMSERQAVGVWYWPGGKYGTSCIAWICIRQQRSFWVAMSGASNQTFRSVSSSGLTHQPGSGDRRVEQNRAIAAQYRLHNMVPDA